MRLIKEIPHAHYLIQIHEYNGKYILKIALDNFEQTFKIPTSEVMDLSNFADRLKDNFYSSCLKRFLTMREDFTNLLKNEND